MARELSLSDFRKSLPSLIDEVVQTNQEIVVLRRGKRVATLIPYREGPSDRYPLRGLGVWMSDDFDEPMEDLWDTLSK
jgi:prevent-host-death family protein